MGWIGDRVELANARLGLGMASAERFCAKAWRSRSGRERIFIKSIVAFALLAAPELSRGGEPAMWSELLRSAIYLAGMFFGLAAILEHKKWGRYEPGLKTPGGHEDRIAQWVAKVDFWEAKVSSSKPDRRSGGRGPR